MLEKFKGAQNDYEPNVRNIRGNIGLRMINTYFGFKNGKLVSVLQSVNCSAKKAMDCTYYIAQPQEFEKQIKKWKKEKTEVKK